MYQIERAGAERFFVGLRSRARVNRNVWYLGVTSLFTDLSSEMVATALPAYLVLGLGFTPLAFGAIDGLYQGISSIVRAASGVAADRSRRHKAIALAGYAISAVCKIGLLIASGWTAIASVVAIDRVGKGIRTAPRDALISLSSGNRALGASFGVHRSLDAAGALLGPLAAFVVLTMTPRAFGNVFILSFSAAVVGVAILVFFVEDVRVSASSLTHGRRADSIGSLFRDRPFRYLVIGASVLALATIGDGFVYLQLQRSSRFNAAAFPLMAFGTAGTYMLLATPSGRLADRLGMTRTFLIGHVVLLPLDALLWSVMPGMAAAFLGVAMLGTYYALTDGVLAATASSMLDADVRATGLAILGTAVSLSRLISSFAFGALWTAWGPRAATLGFAAGLFLALPAAAITLAASRPRTS